MITGSNFLLHGTIMLIKHLWIWINILFLIYLVQKSFRHYADILIIHSEEQFYTKEEFEIEKINLIEISEDLSIAKETVRRKINELNEEKIIMRKGKKIILKPFNICSSKTKTFN